MKQSVWIEEAARLASASLGSRASYVYFQCRQRAFIPAPRARISPHVHFSQRRMASSTSDDFTERLRKKLWRTPDPAAQHDPDPDRDQSGRDQENQWEDTRADTQALRPYNARLPLTDSGDYTPANTWDGLESIGGPEGWWEETWDQNNRFEGFALCQGVAQRVENAEYHSRRFMAPHKIQTREDISKAIHQAFVEIFTLKEAGLPIDISRNVVQTCEADYIKNVSFEQALDGTTIPIFAQEQLRKEILDSLAYKYDEVVEENDELDAAAPNLSETNILDDAQAIEGGELISQTRTQGPEVSDLEPGDLESTKSTAQPEEPFLGSAPNDETWLSVRFHAIDVKFAVLKRVMQLTGVRIPDPAVDGIKSGKGLLGFLVKKPKPKKLAQLLETDDVLMNLPNVKMMDRRYTPIDKEKEVGRWKMIEEELMMRGLPITGGHQQSWAGGKA